MTTGKTDTTRRGCRAIALACTFVLVAMAAWAADFDIRDHGAKGDGKTDDTAAIQRTIDACVKAGGGRVVVSRGIYMSYTITLGSNVDLHLEEGAVIRGGTVGEKYPDFTPSVFWRPERSPRFNRKAFLYTVGATNVALTGTGEIDGNAEIFHRWSDEKRRFVRISDTNLTGRCVFFVACRNVRVEDVLIRRPTGWATWFLDCDNLKISRLRIACNRNYMNGDGIHLGACRDVVVTDCNVDSEDDALILRAHQEQMIRPRPLERVLVSNCVFRAQRPDGIRLGWSGDAPLKDIVVTHCRITHSGRGIECRLPGIYRWSNSDPPRGCKLGGTLAYAPEDVHRSDWLSAPKGMLPFSLENIRFEHLDVRAENCPIFFEMFAPKPDGPKWHNDCDQTPTTPFKNVVFAHCRFYCNAMPSFAPPPLLRFEGLVFEDVQFLPWIPEDHFGCVLMRVVR